MNGWAWDKVLTLAAENYRNAYYSVCLRWAKICSTVKINCHLIGSRQNKINISVHCRPLSQAIIVHYVRAISERVLWDVLLLWDLSKFWHETWMQIKRKLNKRQVFQCQHLEDSICTFSHREKHNSSLPVRGLNRSNHLLFSTTWILEFFWGGSIVLKSHRSAEAISALQFSSANWPEPHCSAAFPNLRGIPTAGNTAYKRRHWAQKPTETAFTLKPPGAICCAICFSLCTPLATFSPCHSMLGWSTQGSNVLTSRHSFVFHNWFLFKGEVSVGFLKQMKVFIRIPSSQQDNSLNICLQSSQEADKSNSASLTV